METLLKVLSEDEKAQIHERTLKILSETGVQVNTEKGRKYLKDAGADVDENTKIGLPVMATSLIRGISQ